MTWSCVRPGLWSFKTLDYLGYAERGEATGSWYASWWRIDTEGSGEIFGRTDLRQAKLAVEQAVERDAATREPAVTR